jgi:2-isopropylmalate synthase
MDKAKKHYLHDPDYLRVFATDLRDGRQGRRKDGRKMTVEEAVRIAKALNTLKVDVAEVGFPANAAEKELVQEVIPHLTYPTVAVFARDGVTEEINKAFESIRELVIKENRGRICLLTKTGERVSNGLSEKIIVDRMSAGTRKAAKLFKEAGCPADIYTYWEGSSEAPVELLCDLMKESVKIIREEMGNLFKDSDITFGLCDTNGSARRGKIGRMISVILKTAQNGNPVPTLAVHAHNDMGLALSNSLEGIGAGARQADGCVNGNGERYGNADIISVIGNVHYDNPANIKDEKVREALVNPAVKPLKMGVDIEKSFQVSHDVARAFGEEVDFRRPFVGMVNGRTVAGMHNAGEAKNSFAFKTVNPNHFGVPEEGAVMGDLMGSAGVMRYLVERNIHVPKIAAKAISDAYSEIGGYMDEKEFMHRFVAIQGVEDMLDVHISLEHAEWGGASEADGRSNVKLVINKGGEEIEDVGDSKKGDIAAATKAFCKALGKDFEIADYHEEVLHRNGGDVGAEADVIVCVTVRWNGETRTAYSRSPKSTKAGISALCHAINSFSFWNEKKDTAEKSYAEAEITGQGADVIQIARDRGRKCFRCG